MMEKSDGAEHTESLFPLEGKSKPENAPATVSGTISAEETDSPVPVVERGAAEPLAPEKSDGAEYRSGLVPRIHEAAKNDLSYGKYLRELRLLNGYTIDQIAEETKIRSTYLEALESEDLDLLPPLTYILGYVRKLCTLYKIPGERADELTAELRSELEYELPENIEKSILDHEVSEENERKLRQLTMVVIGGVLVIAALLIAGGIMLWNGFQKRFARTEIPTETTLSVSVPGKDSAAAFPVKTAEPGKMDEAALMKFQPPSELRPTVLSR